MKTRTIGIICLITLILGGIIIFALHRKTPNNISGDPLFAASLFKENAVPDFDSQTQETKALPDGYILYINSQHNFSFAYPQDYTVGKFQEESGEVVLIQKEGDRGVQIHISAFDESSSVLTPERIKQDVPDIVINNSKPINLGDKTEGVYFQSQAGFGPTHEFWFVYKGTLYQLSAPIASGELVETIVSSFEIVG